MISYSQNGEDVLLARAFRGQPSGFYVDVGANHPVEYSITKHFYDTGWRGVNVEPSQCFAEINSERPRDANLNVAVSDRRGMLRLYEFPDVAGLSTVSLKEAALRKSEGRACVEHDIPCRTLADICSEYVKDRIDFMSIDVEGHEREVLLGNDWNRWRPRIVLVEATFPNTTVPSHSIWEDILLTANYHFAYFDGLNRFYVRDEDLELAEHLKIGVNIFDRVVSYRQFTRVRNLTARVDELQAEVRRLKAAGRLAALIAAGAMPVHTAVRRAKNFVRRLSTPRGN